MRTRQEYEALLANPNVQRGLAVIRYTEGTARHPDPYSITFGDRKFDVSKGHPGTLFPFRTKSGQWKKTSAHGAYQFLRDTWGSLARRFGFKDMSPRNQDVAALALIDEKGALENLVAGELTQFVEKAGGVWASLPSAPAEYDQPTKSWKSVQRVWESASPEPVERGILADLPLPERRPSEGLLASFPTPSARPQPSSLLSAINPISSATAAELPPSGLLHPQPRPETPSLLVPLPPRPVSGPDTIRNEQFAAMPIPEPEPAPAPMTLEEYEAERLAEIAASPESMTAEEYNAQEALKNAYSKFQAPATPAAAQILPPPTTVAPAPAVAPAPTATPQYPPVPSPASALDVWQGRADFGTDNTGAYTLNRSPDGRIYRYSSEYDRTDVLGLNGEYKGQYKGQHKGRVTGPVDNAGIQLLSFGNFNIKPATRAGETIRGFGGGMAGGIVGGLLGGPMGILGAAIGKELANGRNPMGLLGGGNIGTFTQGDGIYPTAPRPAGLLTSMRNRNSSSLYDPNAGGLSASEEVARRNSISPLAAAHVARGGAGLF